MIKICSGLKIFNACWMVSLNAPAALYAGITRQVSDASRFSVSSTSRSKAQKRRGSHVSRLPHSRKAIRPYLDTSELLAHFLVAISNRRLQQENSTSVPTFIYHTLSL